MTLHGNAALTPKKRLLMCRRVVEEGWSVKEAATASAVSERTCAKWLRRFRAEGPVRVSTAARPPSLRPEGRRRGRPARSQADGGR
jgi:transposase